MPSIAEDKKSVEVPQEELLDLVEAARYGELDTLTNFIHAYGSESIAGSVDEEGLTPLHMAAANGHKDVVKLLLEILPSDSLIRKNKSGNTPLHWAALNGHLGILRLLTPLLTPEQIEIENEAGETACDLAEERGSEQCLECAGYLFGQIPEDPEESKQPLKEGDVEDAVESQEALTNGVQKMDIQETTLAKEGLVER